MTDPIFISLLLARHLHTGGEVTSRFVREQFGVSKATAKRYVERITLAYPDAEVSDAHGAHGRAVRLAPSTFSLFPYRA